MNAGFELSEFVHGGRRIVSLPPGIEIDWLSKVCSSLIDVQCEVVFGLDAASLILRRADERVILADDPMADSVLVFWKDSDPLSPLREEVLEVLACRLRLRASKISI